MQIKPKMISELRTKLLELGYELPYEMDAVKGVWGILFILIDEIKRLKERD